MYALGPKSIGTNLNLQDVQLFVDFCNISISGGNMHTSVTLPNFRALCLSMHLEVVDNGVEKLQVFNFSPAERNHITKLYTEARWFTLFTTRQLLADFIPLANIETAEIIDSILTTVDDQYTGRLFIISTVALGTPEESTIPKTKEEEKAAPTTDQVGD